MLLPRASVYENTVRIACYSHSHFPGLKCISVTFNYKFSWRFIEWGNFSKKKVITNYVISVIMSEYV